MVQSCLRSKQGLEAWRRETTVAAHEKLLLHNVTHLKTHWQLFTVHPSCFNFSPTPPSQCFSETVAVVCRGLLNFRTTVFLADGFVRFVTISDLPLPFFLSLHTHLVQGKEADCNILANSYFWVKVDDNCFFFLCIYIYRGERGLIMYDWLISQL